ncbi:hypothetical protein CRUP_030079 [Coryphaenoides rupestris]|nr:hypothetical protein CRUP_030079 [Coryphaenoides rupestris]
MQSPCPGDDGGAAGRCAGVRPLEEFICTVSDMVPHLLNPEQKAQLLLGLRARVVLDLCRADQITEVEMIDMHLDRIKAIISTWAAQPYFAEVQFPESNFVSRIESLLKDPQEREKFFQEEFPVDFGPDFDAALQMLVLDFLSRLERLLPIPDLQHTASLLDAVPSALQECLQAVPDPQQLRAVLQYHSPLGHVDLDDESQSLPSSFGNCILSSLALPQMEKLVIEGDQLHLQAPASLEPLHGCLTVQLEGDTVTLLDYIHMQQQHQQEATTDDDPVLPDAGEGHVPSEDRDDQDGHQDDPLDHCEDADPMKPASFQPLKQSKRLQLKRSVLKEQPDSSYSPTRKRTRRRYPSNKTCPVCSKSFLRATAMRRHLEIHSDNRQLKYKCPNCDKRFRDQYDMTRHNMREEEGGAGNRTAVEAGASIKRAAKACPVCARAFDNAKSLNKHMQCHTEERPYHCVHCKRRFKHMHSLKRHQIYAICHKKIVRSSAARKDYKAAAADSQQGPALKIPKFAMLTDSPPEACLSASSRRVKRGERVGQPES